MALFLGLGLLILTEISLYVTLGAWMGLTATLAIVIGTAVIGVLLVRTEGRRTLDEGVKAALERRNPLPALGHGGLKALAAILLILPGFLTDICGLLLLVPPIRRFILRRMAEAARRGAVDLAVHRMTSRPDKRPGETTARDVMGEVIDGKVEPAGSEALSEDRPHRGHSGWTKT